MTLGQRIQELRKQAGLSQEGLGEALGVSRQAVSKWEGDNGIPELDTLIAMSKLFGIPVGQLLGVEAPEESAANEEKETAGFTEEQVEEILRRYAQESRQQDSDTSNGAGHHPIGSWIIAGCVVIAAVIIAVLAVGKVRNVVATISNLQSQISVLHSDLGSIRSQVGGLSNELRDVIEEQSSNLSTFDCEVVSFDLERETVDVKLAATLKTYTAGHKVQFVLNWKKVDDTEGETVCDPVEGPYFEATVTIPMNFHLEVGARIHGEDGTIYEQPVDIIYSGMHPGEFALQFRSAGSSSQAKMGFYHYELDIYSVWPKEIYPVSITTVITLNDQEAYRQEEIIIVDGGAYRIEGEASLEDYTGKEFYAVCYVTDNFGRVYEFELPGGGDGTGGIRVVNR